MQGIKEWLDEVLSLPEQERINRIIELIILWGVDWEFFKSVYASQGLSNQEINNKRLDYMKYCNEFFKEYFDIDNAIQV